jgi:hypothetical protein
LFARIVEQVVRSVRHFEVRGLDRFTKSADASIMTKHQPKKLPRDVNSRANAIGKIATGETVLPEESDDGKNPAAVALGRLGGQKGGKARAAKLSKKRQSEIGRKAAKARWNKRSAK